MCAISSGLLHVLAHHEQVLPMRLCYVEDVCLSAIWLVSASMFRCRFACLCVMFGFMEMFGPQGSVGFMCVISLFVPDICS